MVTKEVYYIDFDVDEVTSKINSLMSRWSVNMIKIRGQNWQVLNHSNEVVHEFHFFIDFNNIEGRIKLEDLKLNVIHHIESLRDDTTYTDEMVIAELLY